MLTLIIAIIVIVTIQKTRAKTRQAELINAESYRTADEIAADKAQAKAEAQLASIKEAHRVDALKGDEAMRNALRVPEGLKQAQAVIRKATATRQTHSVMDSPKSDKYSPMRNVLKIPQTHSTVSRDKPRPVTIDTVTPFTKAKATQ